MEEQMIDRGPRATRRSFLPQWTSGTHRLFALGFVALALCLYRPTANIAAEQSAEQHDPDEEYGEFLAKPEELATPSANRIARSLRLNAQAMSLGKRVYEKNCAECHGADLKGLSDRHTPDLTDAEWRFSGDDLLSGGLVKFPSDVEWTVRYGIRSEHEYTRGSEVNMLAYDPQYRHEQDKKDFGEGWFL